MVGYITDGGGSGRVPSQLMPMYADSEVTYLLERRDGGSQGWWGAGMVGIGASTRAILNGFK